MKLAPWLLLVATSLAHADPSHEVKREFEAGVDAFRLGKYAEARAHLEKAKTLDPKLPGPPRFLAAVAQAEQRWQDCIDATRDALALNPTSSELDDTRKLHDECRASAGRPPYRAPLATGAAIALAANISGATVRINGITYGGTPLAPRPVPAGKLTIDVVKLGYKPAHAEAEALPGIVTDVSVDLEPDPAVENVTPHPKTTRPPVAQPPAGCCGGGVSSGATPTSAALFVGAVLGRRRSRRDDRRTTDF